MSFIKIPGGGFLNAGGAGLRTVTPIRPDASGLPAQSDLVALWRGDQGITLSGSDVTVWTDQVGALALPGVGTPTIVTSPGGTDAISIGASDGFDKTDGIGSLPTGASPRTLQWVGQVTEIETVWGGFSYGSAVTLQSFGIIVRGDSQQVTFDWFDDYLDSGVGMEDQSWRVITVVYNGNVASLYVGKALVATVDLVLNTSGNDINVMLSYGGSTRRGTIGAIAMWDTNLNQLQVAEAVDYWQALFIEDATAPVVSNVAFVATSPTAGRVDFETTETGGLIYAVLSTSATPPSISQIKLGYDSAGAAAVWAALPFASSSASAVISTTTDPFDLTASTQYYPYVYHEDDFGNNSGVVAGTDATTPAADVTAPTLSSATASASGSSASTGSVTTDEGNGTISSVYTLSATQPTAAQIEAGTDHNNVPRVKVTTAVSSTGGKSISGSGLSASTTYYRHDVHRDAAGNASDVISTSSFTTAAAPTGTTVSNLSQLQSALSGASPGGLILLNNGSYTGTLSGYQFTGANVTIRAVNALSATFGGITLSNCRGIRLEGLSITTTLAITNGCQNITFYQCKYNGFFGYPSVGWTNLTFEECDLRGANIYPEAPAVSQRCTGFTLRTCIFGTSTGAADHIQIKGAIDDPLIENCTFWDLNTSATESGYVHGDFIQALNRNGLLPNQINIRGNHMVDLGSTNTYGAYIPQVCFISDGTYQNVIMEQNLVSAGAGRNGLALSATTGAGLNCIIRRNSVLKRDDGAGCGIAAGANATATKPAFYVPNLLMEYNIAIAIFNDTGTATVSNNYTYGATPMTSLVDWTNLGHEVSDFRPFVGSPVENGYGAEQRLADLAAGARYYHPTNGLQDGA